MALPRADAWQLGYSAGPATIEPHEVKSRVAFTL